MKPLGFGEVVGVAVGDGVGLGFGKVGEGVGLGVFEGVGNVLGVGDAVGLEPGGVENDVEKGEGELVGLGDERLVGVEVGSGVSEGSDGIKYCWSLFAGWLFPEGVCVDELTQVVS